MRLFIGIDLNPEVKDYLYNIEKTIGNTQAKISWVAKKNLHITLKFLGEINEDKIEELKERLKKIKFSKFKLKLDSFGVFPDEKYIRVIWVGVKPVDKLNELQRKVDEETIDLSKEKMEFIGHLSLGRVKSIKNKEGLLKKIRDIEIEKLEIEVNEFKLFKSVLSREGSKYFEIEKYALAQ